MKSQVVVQNLQNPSADWLSITLIIGIFALIIGVGCLAVVAWANAGRATWRLARRHCSQRFTDISHAWFGKLNLRKILLITLL
jgi:hypothetical protein